MATIAVTLVFLLLSLCGCGTRGQDVVRVARDDLEALPGTIWQDNKDYIGRRENIALMLLGGGASGYVRCAHDEEIDDHFKGHHTFSRDFNIAVGAIPLTELSLAGTGYLFGACDTKSELYQVSKAMLEAQALNGIYTILFKAIGQDKGPNEKWMPAWPSGHVSISVTFATVLNEFYGPGLGIPLYALSGFVGYERMETRQHWASDVVFGAVIGYTVGTTVAGGRKAEIFGMDVAPYVNPESGAVGVVLYSAF